MMKNKVRFTVYTLLLACMALSACSSTSVKTYHYTLSSDAAEMLVTRASTAEPKAILGIGPIDIPELFDRSELVSYDGHHQVQVSDRHFWAGDLKMGISRKLTQDISVALPSQTVWPFPWDTRVRPHNQVGVTIVQMGGELGGNVKLLVFWRLLGDKGKLVVKSGEFSVSHKTRSGSHQSYVEALNLCLSDFSQYLVASVL